MQTIKIILGGGAGLCGSHFSRYLLNKGYDVVILDDFSESRPSNLDPRAKFYFVDIQDFEKVNKIFDIERPDYVYGMQAHAAECLSPFTRLDNYKNNLLTEISLINASVNFDVKKIIGFSSMAAYGNQQAPFTEDMSLTPIDPYGLAKKALEEDHEIAKEQFGLAYSIVRPHNFQGPMLSDSIYRNFLGIAIRKALNNEPIIVFGSGQQKRAFSHVKFLCEPLEKLLFTDLKVVNIGADKPYTILETAQIIERIATKDGKKTYIEHAEPRHEVEDAYCDHTLAKEKLQFIDKTDLEELCVDIYNWMKTQPKPILKKANFEITKNMYSYWK